MTNRKLSLRREALTALPTGDLSAVVGASANPLADPSCSPALCTIVIWNSVKPTCQQTLCEYCPR